MASRRLADTPTPARRRQAQPSLPMPPDDSGRSARDLLLNSWPGRLFIIAAALKVVVGLVRVVGEVPTFLQVLSTSATIGLAFSVLFFLTRLVFLVQRRLLWRVRRKLILSYIFIGVVPSLLILGFFLLSTGFVAGTVGAYLFRDGYDDVTRQVELLAEAAVAEIGRVLRPGGRFIFCVPGDHFAELLFFPSLLRRVGAEGAAGAYERYFNRISRHHHCDGPETWERRLNQAGLELVDSFPYFSRRAHHALDLGHYLGLPSLVTRKLFGRWVLVPTRWNLALTERTLRPCYEEPRPAVGAYLFFVAKKA